MCVWQEYEGLIDVGHTTAHPWCDGHSTSMSTCGVWRARAEVQVSTNEFYTHIQLD